MPSGGENGFNQAIELSAETLANVKFVQEKRLISRWGARLWMLPTFSSSSHSVDQQTQLQQQLPLCGSAGCLQAGLVQTVQLVPFQEVRMCGGRHHAAVALTPLTPIQTASSPLPPYASSTASSPLPPHAPSKLPPPLLAASSTRSARTRARLCLA